MIIVQYSGGIGSWGAAKRAVSKYGKDNVTLLFADTKMEDEDLYRFLEETVNELGCKFIKLEDGRTPWQVFKDVRFLGNSRADPCSRVLKRDLLRKWVHENCNENEDIICIGIDWTEEHRFKRAEPLHAPFKLWAPLCEPPHINKQDLIEQLKVLNIKVPRLYEMGFPHNNCGGFCIKAGQAQFKKLLEQMPERYKYHEEKEKEMMQLLNRKVTVLRDRRGGKSKPLSMSEFRERVEENDKSIDSNEWGGCGCAID